MRTVVFNADNKQREVRNASGVPIGTYYYDGEGKRVKKVTDLETTVYLYSGGKLIAEYSTATPPANPTTNYTVTDMLGSPRVLTNSLGEVVSRRDFAPFGEEIYADTQNRTTANNYSNTGEDAVRKRFTGYEKDTETGLDFAENRMYENRYGRFTAVDPLLASGKSANPQTFNRYVYTMNRPLVLSDPDGLQAGNWYKPINPDGALPYRYQSSPPDKYELVTQTNRKGQLIGPGVGLDNNHVVRLNPNGPMPIEQKTALLTSSLLMYHLRYNSYEFEGYDIIASDAYEDSSIEHPADDYVRGSELANPLEVALFCTPIKGAVVSSIARSFATKEGGAVFYSGGGRATGEFAQAFATNTGRQTIEMTPGGKVLDTVTNFSFSGRSINNSLPSLSDRIWAFGSKRFAEGASGQASVILKSPFRTNSTFFRIEQPILQQNPNVFLRPFRIPSCTTRPLQ